MNTKLQVIEEARNKYDCVAIMAIGPRGECGLNSKLPWHLPDDLRFFAMATRHSAVVMGSRTFDRCLEGKPLKDRTIVVMSKQKHTMCGESIVYAENLIEAMVIARVHSSLVFVAGGPIIWELVLSELLVDALLVTHVWKPPEIEHSVRIDINWEDWKQVMRTDFYPNNGYVLRHALYERNN